MCKIHSNLSLWYLRLIFTSISSLHTVLEAMSQIVIFLQNGICSVEQDPLHQIRQQPNLNDFKPVLPGKDYFKHINYRNLDKIYKISLHFILLV